MKHSPTSAFASRRTVLSLLQTFSKFSLIIFGGYLTLKLIHDYVADESSQFRYVRVPLPDHIFGLTHWPAQCATHTHTPVGLIFIRTKYHSTSLRNLLRKKWAELELTCGYQMMFVAGKLQNATGRVQEAISEEAAQYGDVLQSEEVPDLQLNQAPSIINVVRDWIDDKCEGTVDTAIVANNVADDGLDLLHGNAVVYELNPEKQSLNASLQIFGNCIKKISVDAVSHLDRNPHHTSTVDAPLLSSDVMARLDLTIFAYLMMETRIGLFWTSHGFVYLRSEPKFCANRTSTPPFIILFTHSSVENFIRREKIRQTWGSPKNLLRNNIMHLFFVGSSNNRTVMDKIVKESETHNDLIQESYTDTFRNLGIKHRGALKFFNTFCQHVNYTYLMKTDDDVVLDLDSVRKYLHTISAEASGPLERTLHCFHISRNEPVSRDPGNKWNVAAEEYPGRRYPPYCHGAGYLMTRDMVSDLYNRSLYTKTFWIDDIYITGFLARNLGNVAHVPLPNQSPYLSKGAEPVDVLKHEKWMVHGSGAVENYDKYWQAFQSRWNRTAREVFRVSVRKRSNVHLKDDLFRK